MTDLPANLLETNRLLLRRFTRDDLDALAALYSDAEVTKYVYAETMTYEETREELDWILGVYTEQTGFGLWATIHKETGALIGRCGLLQWTIDGRLEVELAYALAKMYWGQGLGTEVAQALARYGFEDLHLTRIICVIEAENAASIVVAKRLGMTFEKEVDTGDGPELLYARNNQLD